MNKETGQEPELMAYAELDVHVVSVWADEETSRVIVIASGDDVNTARFTMSRQHARIVAAAIAGAADRLDAFMEGAL